MASSYLPSNDNNILGSQSTCFSWRGFRTCLSWNCKVSPFVGCNGGQGCIWEATEPPDVKSDMIFFLLATICSVEMFTNESKSKHYKCKQIKAMSTHSMPFWKPKFSSFVLKTDDKLLKIFLSIWNQKNV